MMPEILSSRRMQGLKKLVIEAPLSKKVSHTIVRHPGLREFELRSVVRMIKETIRSVLTVISSQGCQGTILKIDLISMFGVNPGLLAKAVTKLETLQLRYSKLT